MAAAEARAIWQRTANRCFVQEDAKRAPKLACCPSSSSSSKQVDAGPASAADGSEHLIVGLIPLKRIPSGSNLSRETKWWLQEQPNYVYQKGLVNEQLNNPEAEVEIMRAGIVNSTTKLSGIHPLNQESRTNVECKITTESSINASYGVSAACIKRDPRVIKQELKVVYNQNAQEFPKPMDLREHYELMETDLFGCSVSKQPNDLSLDSESPLIGAQKTEPWWRTADREELASLVAKKSLNHIENCDLPQPQNTNIRRDAFSELEYFDHDGILASSLDWKAQSSGFSNPTVYPYGSPTTGSPYKRQWASVEERHSKCYSEEPFRNSYGIDKDAMETQQISVSDPGKAQLLEALRHSQTRAREAEKAAKQACAEKEHIIKLFFRQASQLFAYKQWFQLLQLETFYFQIKNNDQPISTLFPVALPYMPYKARKQRRSWQKVVKGKRGKRGRPRYDISKYAVAFALGLSLVGAGLLLGWTVGWMLPTF